MADSLWTVDATLKNRGFTLIRPPAVYEGPISVHGTQATVEIEIPDLTFVQMPTVKLIDKSKLSVKNFAHLMGQGAICYVGEGGLPLDLYNPGGSVLRVLVEAEAALERSFGGRADTEFEAELQSYWAGMSYYFAVPHAGTPRIVQAEMIPQRQDETGGLVVVPKGAWQHLNPKFRWPVTILTFDENLRHTAEFPFTTLADAIAYISEQPNPPNGWKEAVLAAAVSPRQLFLAAPNAIIGWSPKLSPALEMLKGRPQGFRPNFFRAALAKSTKEVGLERMSGNETDLRHCVERNLVGGASLIGKRVALIGCGTIGSNLAKLLVQSGAGCEATFDLYDTDKLSPGNLGRHLLGFADIGRPKAAAVADALLRFHPDVSVEARGVDATKEWNALQTSDLIIDATGDPNVATALNELRMKSDRTGQELAIMHGWVFGNGVAAQSFLNLKDGLACYRCLKTSFDGQWRHNPLKDANSPLRQAPARCGEAGYIPFAVDAPVAAASLMLRAALDWAAGHPGKRLRTTIFDHQAGRENMKWASPDRLESCPACGE